MAVPPPTVPEESLSSQKVYTPTARTRPPQPVEERAFFEQMWSQNFTRSQVKYEIPVEVLTASTPISLSPFRDTGNSALSHHDLTGAFQNRDEEGAGAAEVAAATVDPRRTKWHGAVEMYFDPHRPKKYHHYDLKTLGPHQHHHTRVNKKVEGAGEENDLVVVVRGDNVFGTTVSKSFQRVDHEGPACGGIDTVSISIASYRVVESKRHGKYAQYLVVCCDGDLRHTVAAWKRYSDFSELRRRVAQGRATGCRVAVTGPTPAAVADHDEPELLPNALTSWKLLKKRQRWYRCFDAGYLSLKVFLLERFLHDILFESSQPQLLREFVGLRAAAASHLHTRV